MQPQELTEREQEKQKQHLIKVEEKGSDESLDEQIKRLHQQKISAMQEANAQMAQLGIDRMGEGTFEVEQLQLEYDLPELTEAIERKESSRKKKKEQRKGADRRMHRAKRTNSAAPSRLRSERIRFEESIQEEVLSEDFREIRVQDDLKTLFRTNPNRKNVSEYTLLTALHRLTERLRRYDRAVSRGDEITMEERIQLESEKVLLKPLGAAVEAWFAAGGISVRNGADLSNKEKDKAKEKLSLAIERYEMLAGAQERDMGQRYLDIMFKEGQKKTMFENTYSVQMQLERGNSQDELGSDIAMSAEQREEITAVRTLIAANHENYAARQKLVDRVYREYVETQRRVHAETLRLTLQDQILRQNDGSIPDNVAARSGFALLAQKKRDLELFREGLRRQSMALHFLLRGTEPTDAVSAAYLKQVWGIETELSRSLATRLQNKVVEDREKEEIAVQVQADLERDFRARAMELEMDFAVMFGDKKRELREDPQNETLQSEVDDFRLAVDAVSLTKRLQCMVNLSLGFQNKQKVTHRCLNRKYQKTQGGTATYPESPIYRDSANFLAPIGQGATVTDAAMEACLRNTLLIDKGKLVTGKNGTAAQIKEAFMALRGLYLRNLTEVNAFVAARPLIFANTNPTPLQLLNGAMDAYQLHQKVQALSAGCGMLLQHPRFAGLTEVQKEELRKAKTRFYTVMMHCRDIPVVINLAYSKNTAEVRGLIQEYFGESLERKERRASLAYQDRLG